MLEITYGGNKITATLGEVSAEVKEVGRETGDWSLNVLKNHLNTFGVTYEESGVAYNPDAETALNVYVEGDCLYLSSLLDTSEEWLELETSEELEAIFIRLGADGC